MQTGELKDRLKLIVQAAPVEIPDPEVVTVTFPTLSLALLTVQVPVDSAALSVVADTPGPEN